MTNDEKFFAEMQAQEKGWVVGPPSKLNAEEPPSKLNAKPVAGAELIREIASQAGISEADALVAAQFIYSLYIEK